MEKTPTNLAEVIQKMAADAQRAQADKVANAQLKVITLMYDKSAAYTTVIVFGGYAGFFALWQLTKEHLGQLQQLWSALLILISLGVFVAYEVHKMISVSLNILRKAALLKDPETRADPQRFYRLLNDIDQASGASMGFQFYLWLAAVSIAIGCALLAAGILAFAFISGLWPEELVRL